MAENPELHARERGPGAALAAARIAQNMSIADVARQLKLSPVQVAALEAGEFERLPGPVFVRGFARNYARLLKLDPDRIVDSIAPEVSGGQEIRNEIPSSRGVPFPTAAPRRRPRFTLVALLILVALAAYEFHWKEKSPVVTVTKPVAVPEAPVTEQPRTLVPVTSSDAPAPVEKVEKVEEEATAVMPPAPPEAGESVPVAPALPAADAVPAEAELHLVFEKDSWVQIRDVNGKTAFTRLNPAGSEQRVSGKPPFKLVIGNASGVQLRYNERPIDLTPHIVRDDVARFTLE